MSTGPAGNVKKNLLAILLGCAIAVVGAEIVLRIFDPVRPPDRVEYMVDREAYWRVVPDQKDTRTPTVIVNRQGFRGLRDVGEKSPDARRVFVLGDSYAWGMGVGDESTFSFQLERMAGGSLEVINGGTPGWGAFQFKVRLERRIDELQPDIVVVFINTADILRQPYASAEAEAEFIRQSELRNLVRRASKLVTVTYRLIDRIRLQRQNRQVANAVAMDQTGGVRPELFRTLIDRDVERLRAMAELSRSHGARFVLVAWPQRLAMSDQFMGAMREFAQENGVVLVDMTAALQAHAPEEYSLPNDHHPSPFGHELIAREIYGAIAPPN